MRALTPEQQAQYERIRDTLSRNAAHHHRSAVRDEQTYGASPVLRRLLCTPSMAAEALPVTLNALREVLSQYPDPAEALQVLEDLTRQCSYMTELYRQQGTHRPNTIPPCKEAEA